MDQNGSSYRIPDPAPVRASSTVTDAPPEEVRVTPGHPNGVDSEVTLSEATAPPSLTLGQDATVEPGQGFPGRARRSDLKAEQRLELAERKRQARADAKVQRAEHRATLRADRHAKKLARIGRRKADRIPLADRVPALTVPNPIDKSFMRAAVVVVLLVIAGVGVYRVTGQEPTVTEFKAYMQPLGGGSETDTSGPPAAAQAVNPLASIPCPVTPAAATMVGFADPWVQVTLSTSQPVKLSVASLEAVKFQLLAGLSDPKTAQLDSPDPLAPPRVVFGQSNAVPLFDCAAATQTSATRVSR